MASRSAVAKALAILAEAFPTFTPSKNTVTAWEGFLGDVDDRDLASGVAMVAQTHTFGPPSVAHVREAIFGRVETSFEPNLEFGLLSEDGRPLMQRKSYRVFPDGTRLAIGDGGERRALPQGPDGEAEPASLDAVMQGMLSAPDPSGQTVADAVAPEAFQEAWTLVRDFFAGEKRDPIIVHGIRAWTLGLGADAPARIAAMIAEAAQDPEDRHAAFIRAAFMAGAS